MVTDHDGPVSNPFRPDPKWSCELCTFRSGEHSEWCKQKALLGILLGSQEQLEALRELQAYGDRVFGRKSK